ncbi:MAG: hypothetical protein ACE15F_06770 [bacterium]
MVVLPMPMKVVWLNFLWDNKAGSAGWITPSLSGWVKFAMPWMIESKAFQE